MVMCIFQEYIKKHKINRPREGPQNYTLYESRESVELTFYRSFFCYQERYNSFKFP